MTADPAPSHRPSVTLDFIRVGDMTPNHEYQRGRKPTKVDSLAKNWIDHRVGALIVNRRASGQILIDDGGHRWEAARQRFGDDYELPCVINDDLSGLDESDVFLGVNRDRTAVSKWDEYQVGLKGGHEPYVSIEQTLNARELGAAHKASTNRIGAIQALLRVEKAYGVTVLGETVDILIEAFARAATTWDADMIQAVARLLGTNENLDKGRLWITLNKSTVAQWRAKALNGQGGGSESRSNNLAKVIADEYNKRLGAARQIIAIK